MVGEEDRVRTFWDAWLLGHDMQSVNDGSCRRYMPVAYVRLISLSPMSLPPDSL